MDQISPELIRNIYGYLSPLDVSNLRLVCQKFGEIGLHFLSTEVHLLLRPGSFERVFATPKNPQVCARIRSLFIRADQLLCDGNKPLSLRQWLAYFPTAPEPDYTSIVKFRNPGISSRDARCQIRSMKAAHERLTNESYARYRLYAAEQIELQQQLQWSNKFHDLLCLLPNLDSVTVSTNGTMRPYTGTFLLFPYLRLRLDVDVWCIGTA